MIAEQEKAVERYWDMVEKMSLRVRPHDMPENLLVLSSMSKRYE